MPPERPGRALIIGAGIAGLAAALFFRRIGIAPEVFEAGRAPDEGGAALTLAPNGMAVMGALGLADAVLATGSPIERFAFFDGAGRPLGRMEYAPPGRYRFPGVALTRRSLHRIMLDAAAGAGIPIRFAKAVAQVGQDGRGVLARFADGDQTTGDFLVGADGIHSSVRRLALPEAPAPEFTGLVGTGGFLPRSVASGVLGPGQESTMALCFGPGGFFGFALGDRREEEGAFWWNAVPCDHPPTGAARAAVSGERGAAAFLARDPRWSAAVRTLVEATSRHLGPYDLYDVARLPRWTTGRVVLIGDAAHAVSPHSGQGASQALEDAVVLAKALRAGSDLAPAFTAYEAERRPRAEKVVALGRRSGNAKRRGPLAGAMMRLLMPLFLRFAPDQTWLHGFDPAFGGQPGPGWAPKPPR